MQGKPVRVVLIAAALLLLVGAAASAATGGGLGALFPSGKKSVRYGVYGPPPAPATPSNFSFDPPSPSADRHPYLKGHADAGSSVEVFTSNNCTGSPITRPASTFTSSGIKVNVAPNTTTTLTVDAYNTGSGGETTHSGCSGTLSYTESEPPTPATPTGLTLHPSDYSNTRTPTLSGTADPGTMVEVWKNATCSGTNHKSYTAAAFEAGVTKLAHVNGTTSFSARGWVGDLSNASGCSTPVTYTEDELAPVVSIDHPADGANVDGATAFDGTAGTLSHDKGQVTVYVYSGSTPPADPATATPAYTFTASVDSTDGSWSAAHPGVILAGGSYVVRAAQDDDAGNTGFSDWHQFTVSSGVSPTLDDPADGSTTSDSTPTFDGAAGFGAGSVTVEVKSGATVVETLTTDVAPSSRWSVDASPALPDGTYTVHAVQNGNSSPTHTFHVAAGGGPHHALPAITIAAPADGGVFVEGAHALASYSCADLSGSGLATCAGPVASGAAIATSTVGNHDFVVTATDKLGDSASRTVHYKVLSPGLITITGDAHTFRHKHRLWVDTGFTARCPEAGPDCIGIVTAHRVGKLTTARLGSRRFGHRNVRIHGGKSQKLTFKLGKSRAKLLVKLGTIRLKLDGQLSRGTKVRATKSRTVSLSR